MILSNYAIKFRTAVFVFVAVLIFAGSYSYKTIPREMSPDITIPYVFVSAYYEGTAPSEMEKIVTVHLEKYCNDVEGIKEIRSTSSESFCMIAIEFMAGQDIEKARQNIKNKVDIARKDLPSDLDEPIVDAFNFSSDRPIFTFALSGEADLLRLKNLAEDLQESLELVPGVREVSIAGTREREIRAEVDLTRLAAYRIPIGVVMQRIAQENFTVSAGNIEMKGDKFQVRVPGEYEYAFELRDILIDYRNEQAVYLRDIAEVIDTFKDVTSVSRINGETCVSVSIKKRSGENIVALCKKVKKLLSEYSLPPDIKTTIVMDESQYVHNMLVELENNIASGFFLVIIVLVLFMGGRNSFLVALAIPFSMMISFMVMSVLGYAMNMIVLFSLVLAVGMLVDNAIVIVENIYRNRTLGLSKIDAARRGASEVAWPVITSTLTTLAAFSPLLFWPDIMGQFMSYLPKTLILTLSASLFVGIVINPAVCSLLISTDHLKKEDHAKQHDNWFLSSYERLLRGALGHRVVVFLLGLIFLVLSMQIYGRSNLGQELFPETQPRNAIVSLKFPQGTGIARTDEVLRGIEQKLFKYEDVKFFLSVAGQSASEAFPGSDSAGTHQGYIHVEFLEAQDRKGNTTELVDKIRQDIGDITGAELKVEKEKEGPPSAAPIAVELSGEDFEILSECSGKIIRAIRTVPGLVDLQDDMEEALPELQFKVDRQRAAMLGLDTGTIGMFLRTAIYGMESSKFRADEEEYDITVRFPESQRDNLGLLDRIYVPVQGGKSVPLSSLGEVVYTGGKGSIKHKDQKRMITITGNNQGRTVDEVLADVRPRIENIGLPHGYSIRYAGDTEEMQKAFAFLGKAFLVALALIFVILVIQFNSVTLPVIILFSVLLSLIGVMVGMLVCHMRISVIMTGLGIISLAGIVVNNAIVLIDCILQRRQEGMNSNDAVVAAGRMRVRPVLLTAVTTILGLIPMAVGWSIEIHSWPPAITTGAESSAWWRPMAVAVIFGLGLATILTLVLVPIMYSLSDSITRKIKGYFLFDV